jgi:hypothetical protein
MEDKEWEDVADISLTDTWDTIAPSKVMREVIAISDDSSSSQDGEEKERDSYRSSDGGYRA